MAPERRHVVTVVIDQQTIGGWEDYEIATSMIEPSDEFTLRRPFSPDAWRTCRRDGRIRVMIDGTIVLDGLIDRRKKRTKDGTMEIHGRDRAGRVVQESAPSINYEGLDMADAIARLVDPWFSRGVTLSDARNRKLRMGKGYKVPGATDALTIQSHGRQAGGLSPFGRQNPFRLGTVSTGGKPHPGESRMKVIEEMLSQAGLIAWSSADGKEFFVGRPDMDQAPQFVVRHAAEGSLSNSTCKELDYEEDNGDRYSVIAVVGTGGGTETEFGETVSNRNAVVYDNPDNKVDGTGRDFQFPKRLLMPEQHFDSNHDAALVATREQARRDFKRIHAVATMPYHGQWITASSPTLFAPNTVASVVDEEIPLDDDFLIYACTYKANRHDGETTLLEMVPTSTEIVL